MIEILAINILNFSEYWQFLWMQKHNYLLSMYFRHYLNMVVFVDILQKFYLQRFDIWENLKQKKLKEIGGEVPKKSNRISCREKVWRMWTHMSFTFFIPCTPVEFQTIYQFEKLLTLNSASVLLIVVSASVSSVYLKTTGGNVCKHHQCYFFLSITEFYENKGKRKLFQVSKKIRRTQCIFSGKGLEGSKTLGPQKHFRLQRA